MQTDRTKVHERWIRAAFTVAMGLISATCSDATSGTMAGDGAGCTDIDQATRLAELEASDAEYISIWAKGMQDGSCRGYSAGQRATVDERSDGLACVRAEDDQTCFWVTESMAPG